MTLTDHSAYLARNRDKILKEDLLPQNVMDFYHSLFEFQASIYRDFKSADVDILKVKGKGLPLLKSSQLSFQETLKPFFDSSLDQLTGIIKGYQKDFHFDTLTSALHSDFSLYLQLADQLLNRDYDSLQEFASRTKTSLEGLLFVLVNLFKPVFISLREDVAGDIDGIEWNDAVCPFCSSLPDMSKIVASKNNKRILHCSLCEHEWQFKRVCCTVCGNQDTETLGFYTYEDNHLYRFDHCENCRAYIKTLQIPEQYDDSRYDLAVENIITSFLDASAIDMGYIKP